jgi:hypothetical protein
VPNPSSEKHPDSSRSAESVARTAFNIALIVQILALLVLMFGDIGFDKPGRFGLDFGHLLILAALWFVAVCSGFIAAWKMEGSVVVLLQVGAFVVAVAYAMTH